MGDYEYTWKQKLTRKYYEIKYWLEEPAEYTNLERTGQGVIIFCLLVGIFF